MISLDLDAMVAAAHRLLAAHGLTVDGAGDNDRIISPAITSARDVLALAAALRTERAAREAAEAQHAALAGAVRAYLAAVDAHRAEKTRWQREYIPNHTAHAVVIVAARDAADAARTRLDALLAGAPCGYVPARVVREYLAADAAHWREINNVNGLHDPGRAGRCAATQGTRDAARAALDAALAAAEGRS